MYSPAIPATNRSKPALTPRRVHAALRPFLPDGSRLLIAVSGGPDSIALAALVRELPYSLVIGHVDHGLRAGSARDARFVRQLASRWEIPFKQARVAVRTHARKEGMGIEEAARTLRYQALVKMARQARCRAVATAHSSDDQSETVLMNFLRGAGPRGLAGMPAERTLAPGIRLLRPLLGTPRAEIAHYLKAQRVPYRIDPSNLDRHFFRNRIRHETLPSLERLQPGLTERLQRMADIFREEEGFWQTQLSSVMADVVQGTARRFVIDLPKLFGYHKALSRRILRALIPGLSFPEYERICAFGRSSSPAGIMNFRKSWRVTKKANRLVVGRRETK